MTQTLKCVKYFIDGISGNIHIIITSSTKLNLNLARLRLNGKFLGNGSRATGLFL